MEQNHGKGFGIWYDDVICKTVKHISRCDNLTDKILGCLPYKYTAAYNGLDGYRRKNLTEIRIRADSPCSFTTGKENIVMRDIDGNIIVSDTEEIAEITEKLCAGSVYSRASQIKDGYIPFCGTRVGVCGLGSCIDGEYTGQRRITSLVFRIPAFLQDAADKAYDYIIKGGFENTMGILAVSPPNCGKTTFLRALAARLSAVEPFGLGKRVCIIDERGELYSRSMMKDCLCDVICGIPKTRALEMAIRTMSPQVVIFDETGNEAETELLCNAYSGGVYIAASVHGNGLQNVLYSRGMRAAFDKGVFSTVYLMKENAAYSDGEIISVSKKGDV